MSMDRRHVNNVLPVQQLCQQTVRLLMIAKVRILALDIFSFISIIPVKSVFISTFYTVSCPRQTERQTLYS
jgi:hypothetical protein